MNILEDIPMDLQFMAKVIIEGAMLIIVGIAIFGIAKEYTKEKRDKIEKEYKQILKEGKKKR